MRDKRRRKKERTTRVNEAHLFLFVIITNLLQLAHGHALEGPSRN